MMIKRRKGGRPSKRPTEQEFETLYSGMTQQQIADHYGVTVGTIRRWIREFRQMEVQERSERSEE